MGTLPVESGRILVRCLAIRNARIGIPSESISHAILKSCRFGRSSQFGQFDPRPKRDLINQITQGRIGNSGPVATDGPFEIDQYAARKPPLKQAVANFVQSGQNRRSITPGGRIGLLALGNVVGQQDRFEIGHGIEGAGRCSRRADQIVAEPGAQQFGHAQIECHRHGKSPLFAHSLTSATG